MAPAKVVRVRPGMAGLIAQIAEIAQQSALPTALGASDAEAPSPRGFLVSGYDADRYREIAAAASLTAVVRDASVGSFLYGYGPDDPVDPDDVGSAFIRGRFGPRSPVIKQIATAQGHGGQGFARMLYEDFARRMGADVFAAIVKAPPNPGSERFHTALGFSEAAGFDHPDGRPRGIWRWPLGAQPE